jgi:hypothetical protein
VDEAAIRQSVLGYDQLCALGTQLNVYYEAYDLLGSPGHASASVSTAADGADGSGEATSAAPESLAGRKHCINSAPEWVYKLTL